jgi:beta-phosphoglucomutase-like phosphatase (HAD superfamily)
MTDRRFSLVIFDSDGVLVDSEIITSRVFATMLNEPGAHFIFNQMSELPGLLSGSRHPQPR